MMCHLCFFFFSPMLTWVSRAMVTLIYEPKLALHKSAKASNHAYNLKHLEQSLDDLFVYKLHEAIVLMKISFVVEGISSFLNATRVLFSLLPHWHADAFTKAAKCYCIMIRNTKLTVVGGVLKVLQKE